MRPSRRAMWGSTWSCEWSANSHGITFLLSMIFILTFRMALCVQVYLKMDRVDKAEQQLKVAIILH